MGSVAYRVYRSAQLSATARKVEPGSALGQNRHGRLLLRKYSGNWRSNLNNYDTFRRDRHVEETDRRINVADGRDVGSW